MRYDVNLASRPFVNHVPHLLLLSALAVAAAGLSAWNLARYLSTRSEAHAVGAQLDELARREQQLKSEEVDRRARIAATDVVGLWEDVELADSVLAEKAVAWAELFERLEDLLPWKAALRSVRTSTSATGVALAVDLMAQDQERYLQFVESLQASPCFAAVYPTRETRRDDGQFEVSLSAEYDPTCSMDLPLDNAAAPARRRGGARG